MNFLRIVYLTIILFLISCKENQNIKTAVTHKSYYSSGELKELYNTIEGRKHGEHYFYSKNGSLKKVLYFDNDIQLPKVVLYDTLSGKIHQVKNYLSLEEHLISDYITYDDFGNPIPSESYSIEILKPAKSCYKIYPITRKFDSGSLIISSINFTDTLVLFSNDTVKYCVKNPKKNDKIEFKYEAIDSLESTIYDSQIGPLNSDIVISTIVKYDTIR